MVNQVSFPDPLLSLAVQQIECAIKKVHSFSSILFVPNFCAHIHFRSHYTASQHDLQICLRFLNFPFTRCPSTRCHPPCHALHLCWGSSSSCVLGTTTPYTTQLKKTRGIWDTAVLWRNTSTVSHSEFLLVLWFIIVFIFRQLAVLLHCLVTTTLHCDESQRSQ